mmetsp:Transcript_72081/g.142945  ORF Transcript_72081/g.142945 Transcript_72081/m.142945 type:complete len:237 (-) Transcript_72081:979-1689(-)
MSKRRTPVRWQRRLAANEAGSSAICVPSSNPEKRSSVRPSPTKEIISAAVVGTIERAASTSEADPLPFFHAALSVRSKAERLGLEPPTALPTLAAAEGLGGLVVGWAVAALAVAGAAALAAAISAARFAIAFACSWSTFLGALAPALLLAPPPLGPAIATSSVMSSTTGPLPLDLEAAVDAAALVALAAGLAALDASFSHAASSLVTSAASLLPFGARRSAWVKASIAEESAPCAL